MSLAELKSEIDRLPAAEAQYLAAYLMHRSRRGEAGYAAGLDETWVQMERGEKVRLSRALELNAELRRPSA
jgi:hypothetical protein